MKKCLTTQNVHRQIAQMFLSPMLKKNIPHTKKFYIQNLKFKIVVHTFTSQGLITCHVPSFMLTIPDYQYITSFTNKNITLHHRYSINKFEQKNCTVKFLHNIGVLAKQYSKTVHDTGKK